MSLPCNAMPLNERMECRICWHVYDPALGDELRQVAAGTPFAAVPDDWRCPACDAGKDAYLRYE